MNWIIAIFAAIAAVAGGALLWWRVRVGRELALMQATETSNARDIPGKPQGALVELKGSLRAETLLKGEFSGSECVWYRALTEREVQRVTRDSQGKSRTERHYETVTDVVRFSPAVVADATGSAPIDFTGAKVEGIRSHQRYESGGLMGAVVGGVLGGVLGASGSTLGHRYTEWIIPAGVPVYVLGSVAGKGIGADPAKKNPFVVSHKSEEERTRSLTSTRLWTLIGAVACFAGAAGLVAWALSSGPT